MDLRQVVQEFFNEYYGMFDEPPSQVASGRETWKKLVEKAARDGAFRQRLMQSPLETMAQNGFQLPKGLRIKFVEDTRDTIFIPIPPYIGKNAEEVRHE